jgi:hypothetical protein
MNSTFEKRSLAPICNENPVSSKSAFKRVEPVNFINPSMLLAFGIPDQQETMRAIRKQSEA